MLLMCPRWKGNKEHEARVHWNVQGVPTILRLEAVSLASVIWTSAELMEQGKETARLVEDEIMDKERMKAFIK